MHNSVNHIQIASCWTVFSSTVDNLSVTVVKPLLFRQQEETPDREVYRDPSVVRSEDTTEDETIVKRSQTASRMLSLFRQMEEQKEALPDGKRRWINTKCSWWFFTRLNPLKIVFKKSIKCILELVCCCCSINYTSKTIKKRGGQYSVLPDILEIFKKRLYNC